MSRTGLSIIICCYNSATRIEETLKYVFKLAIPPGCPCEVIVINNQSEDDTQGVAKSTCEKYRHDALSFRILDEPQPGLAFAKMKGVKESQYDTLIFCDDDNHLQEDYLLIAKEILESYPDVILAGGLAKPKFSESTEPWLEDFYPAMAIGPQAPEDGFVQWVYGAGMVLRKSLLEKLQEKNITLRLSGRIGHDTSSGEDAELCQLALFLGFKIYYSSRLCLWHAIAPHRLKKKHYLNAKFENVYPSIYLYLLHAVISTDRQTVFKLYRDHCFSCLKNIFYFTPRSVLGKHRFYSLFMLYRNVQTLAWLAVNKKRFKKAYRAVTEMTNDKSIENVLS